MTRSLSFQAEFVALSAFLAFLPSFEAPKNLFLLLYLLIWLANRWKTGDFGGPWCIWDNLFVLMTLAAYASVFFGGLSGNKGFAAGNDVFSGALLFMAVRRTRFEFRQYSILFAVLIAATLLTLAYGYWGLLVTKERATLGLHSVGHVNHSALFMALAFVSALVVATEVTHDQNRLRISVWVVTVLLFASLMVTVARGAIIPALVFVGGWCVFRSIRESKGFGKPLLLILGIFVGSVLLQPELIRKTALNIEGGAAGSYRPSLARVAALAARQYPAFGVGIGNFGKISPELAAEWQDREGYWFAPDQLYFASHAHNIYANTVAERGLIGLGTLLGVLATMAVALVRTRPHRDATSLERCLWGSAVGAWVIGALGGLFNTTLHHENAMLVFLMVALWLSAKTRQADVSR